MCTTCLQQPGWLRWRRGTHPNSIGLDQYARIDRAKLSQLAKARAMFDVGGPDPKLLMVGARETEWLIRNVAWRLGCSNVLQAMAPEVVNSEADGSGVNNL